MSDRARRTPAAAGPDSRRYLIAANLLCLHGQWVTLLAPMYVGLVVDRLGFSETAAGYLSGGAGVAGVTATVLLGALLVRIDRQLVAFAMLALAVATNLGSIGVTDGAMLMPLRGLEAAADAVLYGLGLAYLAATPSAERSFAIQFAAVVIQQAIGYWITPPLVEWGGVPAFYLSAACFAPVTFWSIRQLPHAAGVPQSGTVRASGRSPIMWMGMGAFALFSVYALSIFTFSERIGAALGLSPARVGLALGVTNLVGLAGSVISPWLVMRFSRGVALSVGTLAGTVVCLGLGLGQSESSFWVAMSGFSIVWSANSIVLLGILARIDPAGSSTVLAQAFGNMAGYGAVLLASGLLALWGHGIVPILAAIGLLAALALGLVTLARLKRHQSITAAAAASRPDTTKEAVFLPR